MREIIFRGKRIDNGEWADGYFADMGNKACIIKSYEPYWDEDYKMFRCLPSEIIPVDLSTVGQFTGLCDKNGKKIFEGDVLRIVENMSSLTIASSWKGVSTTSAQWSNKYNRVAEFSPSGLTLVDYWNRMADVFEVIGNIYDNPELLEENA